MTLLALALLGCAAPVSDTAAPSVDAPETSAQDSLSAQDSHVHPPSAALADVEVLPLEVAVGRAFELGVVEQDVIYAGLLPYVISEDEAVATWGVITSDDEGLHVSWMDRATGEPIELDASAPENIVDFVDQTGLDLPIAWGSTVGSYNSYPWSWRLPMESGTFTLTCGYGCGAHSGGIYYSTDWANGSSGHLLESPASGFVMYRNSSSSGAYGYQLIVEGGSAGSGKEYYYRIAHLNQRAGVTPGWWIGKGRNVGYIGNTGNSTGPHVHFEVIRASSTSGGGFSGADDLPINNWPTSGDSICGGAFTSSNFGGQRNLSVTVRSTGCP